MEKSVFCAFFSLVVVYRLLPPSSLQPQKHPLRLLQTLSSFLLSDRVVARNKRQRSKEAPPASPFVGDNERRVESRILSDTESSSFKATGSCARLPRAHERHVLHS